MAQCARCRKETGLEGRISRTASCPHCGADLHACLHCRYHAPQAHNQCSEPKAEHQRSRDRANFCDYFTLRQANEGQTSGQNVEDVKKRFEDLFRK
ncbi:MAG: hypothetical protein OHK006_18220 [Thermodesulfovibrionales bacterium]